MRITNSGIQQMIRSELGERARSGMFSAPYPGYPAARFSCDAPQLEVPDGEWTLPNSHAQPLDAETMHRLKDAGIRFDQRERPLHPWLEDFIHNPSVGVIGETGAYWNYGPNYTADPIVISRFPTQKVLLIRRGDTGSLALPGGFVDPGESVVAASLRETREETGLRRPWFSSGRLIYDGPVADRRVTAHAWAHTGVVIWRTLFPWPSVRGDDDAIGAGWYNIDALPNELFGSHRLLVELARQIIRKEVELLDEPQQKTT